MLLFILSTWLIWSAAAILLYIITMEMYTLSRRPSDPKYMLVFKAWRILIVALAIYFTIALW